MGLLGVTREQPPPPPAPNVTVNLILETLPLEVLERLRNQLRAAREQRAIPAEATRAVSIGDGLAPPFRL